MQRKRHDHSAPSIHPASSPTRNRSQSRAAQARGHADPRPKGSVPLPRSQERLQPVNPIRRPPTDEVTAWDNACLSVFHPRPKLSPMATTPDRPTPTAPPPRTIRLFLASPGDLAVERRAFKDAIDLLNLAFGDGANLRFVPLCWEDTLATAGGRSQAVINEEIDCCDILVLAILRRWGPMIQSASPLGAVPVGSAKRHHGTGGRRPANRSFRGAKDARGDGRLT